MTNRWKLLAVLFAAVSLIAAACGDGAGDEPAAETTTTTTTVAEDGDAEAPGEAEGEGEEVVRADADLVIWADDTRTPVIRPLAEAFGEANDLTVAVQEVAFDQIRDRFQVAAPAGQGPDIIIGAHDWLGQLVTSGVVAPVDLGAAEESFSEVAIAAMSYDGQLYGLPYAIENIALLRNTELVPEPPATFEELSQIALDLVAAGDADVPLAIQQPDPYHNYPLFSALGGYVFGQNPDGSLNPDDLGIDSEGGLAAARKFGEWAASGLISGDITYDVMIESFGQGRAPFAITGPWAIAQADTGFAATGVPYVVEPIPPVEGGTPRPFVGVQGFMVSAQAQNPLAAQTFLIEVMATEEAQLGLFEAGGRPPAHVGALEQASADPDIQGFAQAGVEGEPLPAIPAMGSVWTAWTDAYSLILTGGAAPEEAFRQAAEQIRALIADS